jgi:hypothetical protein
VSGEAPDEVGTASAVSTMTCGLPLSSDVGAAGVSSAAVVTPVVKALVASALGNATKAASNQLPPNVLAELQVCWLFLTYPVFLTSALRA